MRLGQTSLRPFACSLLAIFVLAGCSSLNPFAEKRPAPACPDVRQVSKLNQMTQYRDGPGRDLTDVVLETRFGEMSGACEYDENSVEVDLLVAIEAARGPANVERTGRFDYFVAITDPQGKVLNKRIFPVELSFERNQNRIRVVEELTQRIPLSNLRAGPDYRILLGFQIAEDQLEDNLRRQQTQ